jgi:hypothetical protein
MLCTRDGLHFVTVSRDDKATRITFKVDNIDKSKTILDGKEVREAIEYQRDCFILCGYDERIIRFVRRGNPEVPGAETTEIFQVPNPSGGEYYRGLMRVSTYHALRAPYIYMRDDKCISLVNTNDRTISIIAECPFDYWAPLTMEVTGLSEPAGGPTPVIIHALEQKKDQPTTLKFFKYDAPRHKLF